MLCRILSNHWTKRIAQEDVLTELFGPIFCHRKIKNKNGEDYVFTKQTANKIFKRQAHVYKPLKNAFDSALKEESSADFASFFQTFIRKDQQKICLREILDGIDDDSADKDFLANMNSEFEQNSYGPLMYDLLYIACQGENKVGEDELPYIQEAGGKCPICGETLVGENSKGFEVVKFTPDSSYAQHSESDYTCRKNRIALCQKDADRFRSNPESLRAQLERAKESLIIQSDLNRKLGQTDVGEGIRQLLAKLETVDMSNGLQTLSETEAKTINHKMGTENPALTGFIKSNVTQYYQTIRSIFSEMSSTNSLFFESLKNQIRCLYLELAKQKKKQGEIISILTTWIENRDGVESSLYPFCNLLVFFFIQNCEVF
jgi:hypothetical protein